jgi:hypothetical protein
MTTQAYILLRTFGLGSLSPQTIQVQKDYVVENKNLPDYTTTQWGQSYLGTPVFSPFAFEDGNYEKNKEIIKYAGIRLDTALIDVSLEKNIVRTQVQGRNGTVKEYISDGDYIIGIKALLVSPNASLSPESAMRKLINLFSVPDSLPIKSDFLQLFSIYRIVIEKPSFKQVQGFNNMIAVEFSAYSDENLASVVNTELLNAQNTPNLQNNAGLA